MTATTTNHTIFHPNEILANFDMISPHRSWNRFFV